MSDDTELKAEAETIAGIVAEALRGMATRGDVRAQVNDLAARVDAHLAELTAAMTQHVDELDAAEREREEARRNERTTRAEEVHADAIRRRVEEVAAGMAFARVTRLVDVAKYFADAIGDDEHDDMAVTRAARLIALCEAEEARRAAEVKP